MTSTTREVYETDSFSLEIKWNNMDSMMSTVTIDIEAGVLTLEETIELAELIHEKFVEPWEDK